MYATSERREQRFLSVFLVTQVALGTLVGCSSEIPPASSAAVDLAAEKAVLLQRDALWQAAVAEKKDVAKIVSFFAPDGIMFGSGEPTDDTREKLTQSVAALVADPSFKDQWTWSRVEMSPDGRLAYLVGTTDITINDASGRPVTNRARLLNVWRKEPDGIWRCVVDVWVDPPPAGH
jgi:ketosteroid isomerase-like protein